jgi:type IV secretion system protein TrbG
VNVPITKIASPSLSKIARLVLLACIVALSGCATFKPPQISYDAEIPPLPNPPSLAEDRPRSLHVPRPGLQPREAGRG